MYIDSHVHLYDEKFDSDRDEVIRRAVEAGVEAFVVPGIDVETSRKAIELSERYPEVYAAVGIHPHEAVKANTANKREIEDLSHHEKVVAIGEIGLDYHYDFSPHDVQQEVFRSQIRIAQRRNLPVIIHNRKAVHDTVSIVRQEMERYKQWRTERATPYSRYEAPKGVFHCFDGDVEDAKRVTDLGMYISFPGIITFKNTQARTVASQFSIEYFLLETDAPYLAPVPHRGKRNEPSYIKYIAEEMAEIQNLFPADVGRATNYNVYRLFGIGELEKPKIIYQLRNSLYLNITLRCNADCVFCDRKGEAVIKGHNLRIENEPTVQEVINAIEDPTRYDEIVFCGYGEPTIRLDAVKEISRWIKSKGGKVRLDTDGHGMIIHKRNIVPELVGLIDSVSVSLNSIDPEQYGKLMQVDGEKHHKAMIEFTREAKKYIGNVMMSVIEMKGIDLEKTRKFVEEEIGVTFKLRPYF